VSGRRRARLTRRGELVVIAAVMVALALVVEAAHASLWIRSWGLAGAAVFGLLFLAFVVTMLLMAVARAAGRAAAATRIRWYRWRFSREAYQEAAERLRARKEQPIPFTIKMHDEISPAAAARIRAAVDEVAQRRQGHGR
jgi:hypothetical protein